VPWQRTISWRARWSNPSLVRVHAAQKKNKPPHITVGHSVISHHSNPLSRTQAPTCSLTYTTHTPAPLQPYLKHRHACTHSSLVHTAALKNESSTGKLRTNLPSLWVNGLVQANNRASPPCHFVLSTPSIYKFFQEMARVFRPLLQARGNFTLIHIHALQPHTRAIRHVFAEESRVCGF
jgi:hypothetical protein